MVANARNAALSPDKDRKPPGEDLVKRRHRDWVTHEIGWRWMLDSYEGGQRYRDAEYGPDRKGRPTRNLIRHKREYPDPLEFPDTIQAMGMTAGAAAGAGVSASMGPFPGQQGADPTATAQDDDYEYRRSRTTPPDFVNEVVSIHTGKIYDQEVSRRGPAELMGWWRDCNGSGTAIGEWMRETVAPLLLVLGNLDICFDRPSLPAWVKIETKQDEIDHGQDTVCAAVILPENMLWWRNDPAGNYLECLVREYWSPTLGDPDADAELLDDQRGFTAEFPGEPRTRNVRYRHWTQDSVTLYDADGEIVEPTRPHGYPGVPIIRLIDQLRHRTPMIGRPRYEFVAHCQRDYYNRDSELILSDTIQAHPLLSGPIDLLNGDRTLSIGPEFVLPKFKNANGEYVDWTFLSPPKGAADSIRQNLDKIREKVDRAACLMKPAGVTGTTGGTVSQSGYSKEMDAESGNKLLSNIAKSLARAERQMAEFALACIRRAPLTPADRAAITITYPSRFQLKQGQQILNELVTLTQICTLQMQVPVAMTGSGTPVAGPPSTAAGPTTPDAQAGGNPPKMVKSGDGLDPASRILMPTLLAEMYGMYARATLPGRGDEVYRQIDREAMAFYHLHALPQLGTASDREAMAGHGTEEQMASEDRTGVSSATSVSPSIPQVL